jgi:hypothetical protein
MGRRITVTSLLAVATLVGPLAPDAVALDGAGASFEYPILLNSPRHATFTGAVDCESPVSVTLRFRFYQNTVAEPPAKARASVECVPFDVNPWFVEFTGGIFHPGTGRFHVEVTTCHVVECVSLGFTSNAPIERATL